MRVSEPLTAWVTSYVMTQGIFKVEGMVDHEISKSMLVFEFEGHKTFAHGLDWHRTEEAAIARANYVLAQKLSKAKERVALWSNFAFDSSHLKIEI